MYVCIVRTIETRKRKKKSRNQEQKNAKKLLALDPMMEKTEFELIYYSIQRHDKKYSMGPRGYRRSDNYQMLKTF